ncbi:synaptogenesis protein syg-2-like isoform X2 [Macrosteles quadrilineatus]|nr:synaptogenesis protein syg-2-like isoform X2 [Macrosteles quadrilineatus]
MEEVSAVLGRGAELPCNIKPSGREDRVYMVLWFREGAGKPLYRYDVRGRSFSDAVMWSDANAFGPRAFFVTGKQPAAALQLDAVQLKDAGVYRCRVDFRNSPTRNFQVKLTVIVPPHHLLMYDNSGREIGEGVVGPLKEGDDLVLKCEVRGGNPAPTVSWFINDKIVTDGKVERVGENVIVNRLEVAKLRRDQLNTTFKCQASNTKLMQPTEKTVRLEMFLKPVSASIITKPVELVAYETYNLTCEVSGSRPTADVTWYREGRKFKRGKVDQDANETVVQSTVLFTTAPEDDGHILKCQANNPKMEGSGVEDAITLNIVYPPIVTLQLGTSLKPHQIKEGDDVYFECNIKSNPREHKISWHHNGQVLTQNMSSGVIFSTHSLVLQGVTRHHAGSYTCAAVNAKGETTSEPVWLRVQFAPVCRLDEPTIVGASIDEVLRVRCEVQADPSDVSFVWQFNNSGESFEVPPEKYATSNGSTSEFRYTPTSERDYGTLTCWGKNNIGRQVEPCVYQLVPASKPSSLRNCTLRSTVNTTGDWLEVECVSGFDGGMPQSFHLVAIDPSSNQVRLNLTTSVVPMFRVDLAALQATTLQLVMYAANQKGQSEPVVLEDIAVRDAEKRTEWVSSGVHSISLSSLTVLLGGVLCGVATAVLIVIVLVMSRRRQQPQHLHEMSVKQLELSHPHSDQQRYVVSYQLKPETKQPDILSRLSDEPQERDAPSIPYNNGPSVMATFMSPCTSPTCSLRSAGSGTLPLRPTTIGFPHSSSPPLPPAPPHVLGMNGTLRAKEHHVLSNSIPGPESCV